MIEVKRSPAKVCWHILNDGVFITTRDTKHAADTLAAHLNKIKGNCHA